MICLEIQRDGSLSVTAFGVSGSQWVGYIGDVILEEVKEQKYFGICDFK